MKRHNAWMHPTMLDMIVCETCKKRVPLMGYATGNDKMPSGRACWDAVRKCFEAGNLPAPDRSAKDVLPYIKMVGTNAKVIVKGLGFPLLPQLSPVKTLMFDCPFQEPSDDEPENSTAEARETPQEEEDEGTNSDPADDREDDEYEAEAHQHFERLHQELLERVEEQEGAILKQGNVIKELRETVLGITNALKELTDSNKSRDSRIEQAMKAPLELSQLQQWVHRLRRDVSEFVKNERTPSNEEIKGNFKGLFDFSGDHETRLNVLREQFDEHFKNCPGKGDGDK